MHKKLYLYAQINRGNDMGKIIKIKDAKLHIPKKYECLDRDSDCLTMDGQQHLKCYVHDTSNGACPFLITDKEK